MLIVWLCFGGKGCLQPAPPSPLHRPYAAYACIKLCGDTAHGTTDAPCTGVRCRMYGYQRVRRYAVHAPAAGGRRATGPGRGAAGGGVGGRAHGAGRRAPRGARAAASSAARSAVAPLCTRLLCAMCYVLCACALGAGAGALGAGALVAVRDSSSEPEPCCECAAHT
jgi:hypothetical protein